MPPTWCSREASVYGSNLMWWSTPSVTPMRRVQASGKWFKGSWGLHINRESGDRNWSQSHGSSIITGYMAVHVRSTVNREPVSECPRGVGVSSRRDPYEVERSDYRFHPESQGCSIMRQVTDAEAHDVNTKAYPHEPVLSMLVAHARTWSTFPGLNCRRGDHRGQASRPD